MKLIKLIVKGGIIICALTNTVLGMAAVKDGVYYGRRSIASSAAEDVKHDAPCLDGDRGTYTVNGKGISSSTDGKHTWKRVQKLECNHDTKLWELKESTVEGPKGGRVSAHDTCTKWLGKDDPTPTEKNKCVTNTCTNYDDKGNLLGDLGGTYNGELIQHWKRCDDTFREWVLNSCKFKAKTVNNPEGNCIVWRL